MLDIRQIRLILTLAEHSSLTRAARVLGLSPSALTRAVSAIERELKVELFDRSRRGFEPTAMGRALIQKGAEVLAQSEELAEMIERLRGAKREALVISAGPIARTCTVGPAIAALLQRAPGIEVQILGDPSSSAVRDLRDRKAILAAAELSDLDQPEEFEIIPLRRHPLLPVVRAGHPLLGLGSAMTLGDIYSYPQILPSRLPARFAPHMAAAGAAAGKPMVTTVIDEVGLALAVTAASDAVFTAPAPAAKPWLDSGALAILPFRPAWLQTNFGLLLRRHTRRTPPIEALLECLVAADAAAFALGCRLIPPPLPVPGEAFAVIGRQTAPAMLDD